jgi:hypothetical protein
MKKIKLFTITMLLFVVGVSVSTVSAQDFVVSRNYKGQPQVVTFFTGTNVSAADTSGILEVPAEIKEGIFYIVADTVTTSDSVKTLVLQTSPDMVHWVTSGLSIANITAVSTQRIAATLVDKYYRLLFTIAGTGVKIDFKAMLVPKL